MAVELPLTGGLITQVDPEEVGSNACTVLENADFTKIGAIRKRKGRGSAYDTGKNFIALKRWHNINISGNYYWIGIDSTGGAWYSTNLTTWAQLEGTLDIGDPSGKPYDGRIYDYNSQLRFSSDLASDAKIFQYIDRDFFWSNIEGTPGFYSDTSRPRKDVLSGNITPTGVIDTETWFRSYTNWRTNSEFKMAGGSLDLSSNVYYYRYSYVFDGNQESELSDLIMDTENDKNSDKAISVMALSIDTGSSPDLANWNRRITGINIYRATNNIKGTYYQIGAVSTLEDDPNMIKVTDAVKGSTSANSQIYIAGLPDGHNLNTKIALVNGMAKTLGTAEGTNGIYNLSSTGTNEWGNQTEPEYAGTFGAEYVDRCWNDPCVIIDSDIYTATVPAFSANTLATDDWYEWMVSDEPSHNSGKGMYGQYSLQFLIGEGYGYTTPELTVLPETDYYVEFWYAPPAYLDGLIADGRENMIRLGIRSGTPGFSHSASDNWDSRFDRTHPATASVDSRLNATGGTNTLSAESNNLQSEFSEVDYHYPQIKAGSVPPTGNGNHNWARVGGVFQTPALHTRCRIEIYIQYQQNDNGISISNFHMGKLAGYGRAFGGLDVIISDDLGTTAFDNSATDGSLYMLGDVGMDDSQHGWIQNATDHAIQVGTLSSQPYDEQSAGTGKTLVINNGYLWEDEESNNIQKLLFFDNGLVNGVEHPTGQTSLNSKYKYSKFINGRNFVGNVKIENEGGEAETHPNWVLFSELSKPDVIPIVNYIQISDAQGGEIVGLANLLGDLAVFMNQGIFRLSIPSTEPTAWSLREAEENIGCISTESITEWEGGVFFAGHAHLYYLNANFQATPVTASIKEDYQGLTSNETRTSYDPKRNKLLCRFGTYNNFTYVLDLSKFPEENWTLERVDHADDRMDICVIDENSDMWSVSENSNYIRKHDDSNTESTTFKRTTGWIKAPDLDTTATLRRLNLRYSSGTDITIKVYIDGDSSTVIKTITIPSNTSGTEWYKTKPGVRCRYFMLEISMATTTENMEIRRLEVEFE